LPGAHGGSAPGHRRCRLYPARADAKGKFTVYLEAGTVSFGRIADRRMLSDMPGADTTPESYVAFRLSAPDGVAHAKAAARKVKR
jgi:hypothetical protein